MDKRPEEELLATCFQEVTGVLPSSIVPLRPHASERRIYRLQAGDLRMVGVVNNSRAENDSFVALCRHFRGMGLPVPAIHAYKADHGAYLEDDLGDTTLLDLLGAERAKTGAPFPARAEEAYIKGLSYLPRFQIEAAASLDFTTCLASQARFSDLLRNDMVSFSQELVGRMLPSFDIAPLSRDFSILIAHLEKAQSEYFLYRDFQSRNIMMVENEPFFIDFQSGIKGPLQYDVVSLLYQSSAQIPDASREKLVGIYLDAVSTHTDCDREAFFTFYPAFIVSRMLQVLGVYGRQGLGAQKEYFARSIPAALRTLDKHLHSHHLGLNLDGLRSCSQALLEHLQKQPA